jgi:cytidylate kinase
VLAQLVVKNNLAALNIRVRSKKGNLFPVLLKIADMIIAIDGYSGTGKSSTAKLVAEKLSYLYVDSGAMYRAVSYYFLLQHVDISNSENVNLALESIRLEFLPDFEALKPVIYLNGKNIEKEIRTPEIAAAVSSVASLPQVRKKMVSQQRIIASKGDVVMDGRDIGTVVFPSADLKIFMTADLDVRAKRRFDELKEKGIKTELSAVKKNLADRDLVDTTRKDSPLIKAIDAIEIDTTNLTFDEQVSKIINLAKLQINEH